MEETGSSRCGGFSLAKLPPREEESSLRGVASTCKVKSLSSVWVCN